MKQVLLFLIKFLGASLLLYAVHKPIMMTYEFVLLKGIFLFPSSKVMPPGLYYDSSLWLIPTIALLLVTPGLSWNRRATMLLLGFCIFLAVDFGSFLIWVTPPPPNTQVSEMHYLYSLVWKLTGQWVLPFMIWIIAAHKQLGHLHAAKI